MRWERRPAGFAGAKHCVSPPAPLALLLARSHLERNRLNGTLPPGWAAPASQFPFALQSIFLASNALTGALPAEWGSLKFLAML